MASNQVHLAKYKGRRLVDPRRLADEYVAIDEVEYNEWPVLEIKTSAGNPNDVVLHEVKFKLSLFLASSPLATAFYENYRYFRVRSVTVDYTSSDVAVDFRRVQAGVYWIPDHWALDNNRDAPIATWQDFMEKPNVSMLSRHGGHNRYRISYVPQQVYQDDIDEDEEDPMPDTVFQVRGDAPFGWMETNTPNKSLEHRGPQVVFRKPYIPSGGVSTTEISFIINVRVILEFKKAKNGN